MKFKFTKIFKRSRNKMKIILFYKTADEIINTIDQWIEISKEDYELLEDRLDNHKEWHSNSYILCYDELEDNTF